MMMVAAIRSHVVGERSASPTLKLTSRAAVGWPRGDAGALAPSGSKPMSSGSRRTSMAMGTMMTNMMTPVTNQAGRQPSPSTSRPM